jgi:hypothetical protein
MKTSENRNIGRVTRMPANHTGLTRSEKTVVQSMGIRSPNGPKEPKVHDDGSTVTLLDVQLASAFYPILVDLAQQQQCLSYKELLVRAKNRYPNNGAVQRAIAVSIGRRLHTVRIFTNARGYPDLTCLIVNQTTKECGIAYTQTFDPEEARQRVFAFDWSTVTNDFDGFIQHKQREVSLNTRPQGQGKKEQPSKISNARLMQARVITCDYYKEHRAKFPESIRRQRDFIVSRIVAGYTVEEAFSQAAAIRA